MSDEPAPRGRNAVRSLLAARPHGDALAGAAVAPGLPGRRLLAIELAVVLALTLGRSGVYSLVSILESATAPGGLSGQTATMHGNVVPERPWFDLLYQLLGVAFGMVPVLLAAYLLSRTGTSLARVWFGGRGSGALGADAARGAGLAAGVGSVGLAFYLVMHALGLNATVVADGLDGGVWWHVPVLVLSALENAVLEEFLVLGYVLVRLRQLGFGDVAAVVLSALLRGSYHLYQGLGGFVGNVAMGLLFGWLYRRWGRVTPLVVAHFLLDVGAFVGYALLAGEVAWLPT